MFWIHWDSTPVQAIFCKAVPNTESDSDFQSTSYIQFQKGLLQAVRIQLNTEITRALGREAWSKKDSSLTREQNSTKRKQEIPEKSDLTTAKKTKKQNYSKHKALKEWVEWKYKK